MRNRHRVLVICKNNQLRFDLVTLLSGYGYFVEESTTRLEGLKSYRSHKQSIVIIDLPILRKYSERMLHYIRSIQKHAIILITANNQQRADTLLPLAQGAYDVLGLPLKRDVLIHTLSRAKNHHNMLLENLFIKNILFFVILLSPLWIYSLYLVFRG